MIGDVQATFCATLVDEWVRCGVTDAVVAPGSRSTPLALALAADERISVHVHLDERAAAFVALGLGAASGRPAVVLTTSGTAAVELHPAVVEADLGGVPLVAVTADRPPELQQVGAPQTVDQTHLFGRSVRWFADPGVPADVAAGSWRSLAARAVAESLTGAAGPGPVHLNLPFREPLVGRSAELPPGRVDGGPWHTTVGRRLAVDRAGTDRLAQLLGDGPGVIVAGAGCGDAAVVTGLASALGWPILADPRSGLRGLDGVVSAFDPILRAAGAGELRPAVVLRLGATPASKVLAAWLRESGAVEVAVHESGRWFDADRTAAHVLHASPTAVAQALRALVSPTRSAWRDRWLAAEGAAQDAIDAWLVAQAQITEPGLARAVVRAMPPGSSLVVSSSMPIRDVEWFGGGRPDVRVLANRGANGIDGVVSTAVGVAAAARVTGTRTAVLVGDVAMQHDANALLGLARRGLDLVVVVVDNDGGGIFSFLPQAAALDGGRFEQLFGTPHGVDLRALAAAHGLGCTDLVDAPSLATDLAELVQAGGTHVVRVRVGPDRAGNVGVHEALNAAVAAAVAPILGA